MSLFERWPSRLRTTATIGRTDVVGRLQSQLAELETDIVVLSQTLAETQVAHTEVEARALMAIHAGDDRSASALLAQQKALGERAAVLEEESRVVRILCDECRDGISAASDVMKAKLPT